MLIAVSVTMDDGGVVSPVTDDGRPAGPHPALLGPFVILKFGDVGAPDMVYIESEADDLFLDDESSAERYNTTFEHLRATALSPTASVDFLSRLSREI